MELNKWAANDKLGQLALALIKIRDQDVIIKEKDVPRIIKKCVCCEVVTMPGEKLIHKSEPFSDGADNPCYIAQQALLLL